MQNATRIPLTSDSDLLIMTAAAQMPGSVRGTYKRVALVEVDRDATPKMISERARGVRQIVETWERLSVGKTDRCAYAVALREASEQARAMAAEAH